MITDQISQWGPLWPPKLPLWIGFPVFARISRVRVFEIGPKFHRLSVSWPYNCVKSLKKVGHSSLEIWAFVTPKIAPLLANHPITRNEQTRYVLYLSHLRSYKSHFFEWVVIVMHHTKKSHQKNNLNRPISDRAIIKANVYHVSFGPPCINIISAVEYFKIARPHIQMPKNPCSNWITNLKFWTWRDPLLHVVFVVLLFFLRKESSEMRYTACVKGF